MAIKSNLNSDYGYYNIIINNKTDDEILANFNETRTTPILSNVQDYYISVVRFKIPTSRIPLFQFELDSTGDSPYYVTFSLNDTYSDKHTVNVAYNPAIADTTDAKEPQNRAIYYYDTFTQMVNDALNDAWQALFPDPNYTTLLSNVNASIANPPFLSYDPKSTLFTMNLPNNSTTAQGNAFTPSFLSSNFINIHFSNKLNYFYNGFNSKILKTGNVNAENVLQFSAPTNNSGFNVQIEPPYSATVGGGEYLRINQNYSTINLWQTLTRLILSTNIPVEQEYLGVQGEDGLNFNQMLLTDFEIEPNLNGNQRDYIYFNAVNPRYQNFTKNGDLSFFDLRIQFQTKSLKVYPLYIGPNEEVTVKLQFKRRDARGELQYSSANEIRTNRRGHLVGFKNYS